MGRPFALISSCVVLYGCHAPQSIASSQLSAAQRAAALDSARDQVVAARAKDPATAAQSLVTYLHSRAEFKEAGVSAGSVWAVLRDGRQLIVPASAFGPLPSASGALRPSLRAAAETEIPEGKAVLVNTTGLLFSGSEFGDLSLDLRGSKYELFPTTGDYWRLRTDVASGTRELFHWKTQSGRDKNGSYVLASSTVLNAEDEADSLTGDDFLDGSLVYYIAIHEAADRSFGFDVVYAITPTFVRKYMRFPPVSLVFIDASLSDDADLKQAFFAAGASVFAGWSNSVFLTDDTSVPVLSFYDGLLGLDPRGVDPPPRQRAFDAESIAAWMAREGLDTPRGLLPSAAHLIVSRNTDQFGLLAASIMQLVVDEFKQELVIVGVFGTTGDLSATVNGTALPVKERHPTFLVVGPLPTAGPGSAGDVRVSVNQHLSNVVQLTEWHGRLIYDFVVETLKQHVTFDVHLRADVHSFRLLPGGTPVLPNILALNVANDSISSYAFSGVYSAPYGMCTITHTWAGSGPIPLLGNGSPLFYSWHGVFYPPMGKLDLALDVEGPAGTDTTQVVCPDGSSESSNVLGIQSALLLLSDNGVFHVGVGSNFTIQGATFQTTIPFALVTQREVATVTLSWADMIPAYPPDPNAHR